MSRFPLAIAITVALSLLFTSAASAAPKRDGGPSGTIALATAGADTESFAASSSDSPSYGDTVWFDTTVEGKTASNSMIYILLACWQDGVVVYQSSAAPDSGFPLVDQGSTQLEWHGGGADCTASLIYRVEKGKNVSITVLDQTHFAVSHA